MNLIYPISLSGHDEWIESGYALDLARGDVITREGEVLGEWRVAKYAPELYDEGGRYEFVKDGQSDVTFSEKFAILDSRMSRGLALQTICRTIKEWYECALSD